MFGDSRMKDLYDLWMLPKSVDIDMGDLTNTIRGTFARRATMVPTACPVGLSGEFSTDPAKMTQWQAYSESKALERTAAHGDHRGDLGLARTGMQGGGMIAVFHAIMLPLDGGLVKR